MAVHLDEEKATAVTRTNSSGTESSQGSLKHRYVYGGNCMDST